MVYDEWRYLGCRFCQVACPFQIPRYEWAERLPAVTKCSFCAERLARGEGPVCVAACPVEALKFGRRPALLAEASRRITEDPDRYVPDIYGRDEVGGTSILYVSDVPFKDLGFPAVVHESLPAFTWRALGKIPGLIVGLGATLTMQAPAGRADDPVAPGGRWFRRGLGALRVRVGGRDQPLGPVPVGTRGDYG